MKHPASGIALALLLALPAGADPLKDLRRTQPEAPRLGDPVLDRALRQRLDRAAAHQRRIDALVQGPRRLRIGGIAPQDRARIILDRKLRR